MSVGVSDKGIAVDIRLVVEEDPRVHGADAMGAVRAACMRSVRCGADSQERWLVSLPHSGGVQPGTARHARLDDTVRTYGMRRDVR